MPFTSETAIYGGKKPGAGRPPKEVTDAWERARQRLRKRLAADADASYELYKKHQAVDPATARHAMDKILGDGEQAQIGTVNIAIGLFEGHQPSTELRQDGLSIRIGGGNGQNGNGSTGA